MSESSPKKQRLQKMARAAEEEKESMVPTATWREEEMLLPLVYEYDDNEYFYVRESTTNAALEEAAKNGEKVLFLCDGPPTGPRHGGQMVVFASPNEKWLRFSRKLDCDLYMPLWTREELHEAALVLALDIDGDEIDKRFEIFGGAARECLSLDEDYVRRATNKFKRVINNFTITHELENLLLGKENSVTRLLHYEPSHDDKLDMMTKFTNESLSRSLVALGPYHKPKSKTWESIDAFYLPRKDVSAGQKVTVDEIVEWNRENRLLLFQMTVSETHDVNASGIMHMLSKLDVLQSVKSDPSRVALVFVVPKE
ncbi:hypothetical protein BBJ28_00020442 [Nothophytophthora sp. Chile5]|nr:hypothetical protein BBJ28_00020442 [Nothophytophthora sp. Chile5]